jgi:Flp pilus assembly protein TadD
MSTSIDVEAALASARQAIDEKDEQRALDALRAVEEIAATDPALHVEVRWLMGVALSGLGRFEEAEDLLARALDLAPASSVIASFRGENAMFRGDAASAPAEKMQHYQHAQNQFHRAVAMSADTATLHYNLACMGSLLGDHDEAVRSLRSAIARDATCRDDARTDPHLASLRAIAEVQALLADAP